MPGKSRRVASRQAQLSRQRRRQSRGPSGIPATPRGMAPQPSDGAEARVQGSVATAHTPPRSGLPMPAGSGSARARAERSVTYNYIGAEFRRILILSGVVLAALIVLAILL
jgi:hypothetical protein